MATTLSSLRDAVRIELRDPDGVSFQDDDVEHAINQAYRKVFLRIAAAIQDYFVTTATFSLVAGTRAYALPSDHLRTKMVEYVHDGLTVPMRRRRRGITVNYTSGVSFNPINEYPEFDFEGNNMVLEPTPLANVTDAIKHTYYSSAATELSADADTIHAGIKDLWKDWIILEAAWACFSQIEALGGTVSTDIKDRLKELRVAVEDSFRLRSLSPVRRRRKGYFQ